jgi:hypothetical protein
VIVLNDHRRARDVEYPAGGTTCPLGNEREAQLTLEPFSGHSPRSRYSSTILPAAFRPV